MLSASAVAGAADESVPARDADAQPVVGMPHACRARSHQGRALATSATGALAASDGAGLDAHLAQAVTAMRAGADQRGGPLPAAPPGEVRERVRAALAGRPIPEHGVGATDALDALAHLAGWGAADAAHPRCAGHLHTPPLSIAVAADTVASALNQSLDSWDQAPAMSALETEVVAALGELAYGAPTPTGGVITTGGTESNLMGLLLARSHACRRHSDVDVMRTGLPADAHRLRIYCSEVAHFSTHRMAGVLGLGEGCVVTVPVDDHHRMRADELQRLMRQDADALPLAVVATAGTTDAGAVDPLREIAGVASEHGCWLHVDAAYGGGALFSDRLAPLLDGLHLADSIALDLHKLGWQPTAAGVFLARGGHALAPLARQVAYLNTEDDEEAGYTSLLGHSLRTTRRPDVLKIAVTLRALGRAGLGALVDCCHDLAHHAAAEIDAHPRFERALPVTLTSVVFRYAGQPGGVPARHTDAVDLDTLNARIRRHLLASGDAVVGRCELDGQVWLKLTLLNPEATTADIDTLLRLVADTGAHIEAEEAAA